MEWAGVKLEEGKAFTVAAFPGLVVKEPRCRGGEIDGEQSGAGGDLITFTAFFTVQLSHPYMTTGKTIALSGNRSASLPPS